MFEMVDPLPGALRLKMPRFVIAWSIVDLVLCSLRAVELPFLIALLFLLDCDCGKCAIHTGKYHLILWLEIASVIAIALTGITGNIAMLCRRNWAQYFCFGSALLTLCSYGVLVWQTLLFFRGGSPLAFIITMIAVTLFIMIRMALLVFDLLSIFKARLFFLERDGY